MTQLSFREAQATDLSFFVYMFHKYTKYVRSLEKNAQNEAFTTFFKIDLSVAIKGFTIFFFLCYIMREVF